MWSVPPASLRDQYPESQYRTLPGRCHHPGEFLAAREGLGYLIIYSSQVFRLDYLIAALIILCVIAFCLYQLIQKLEHQIRKSRLS